ncbi:hypothetical protein SELSPUOL_01266 [Selenomonas sputigena ATCC 35185]|uniref:Uncharacterized protein n=1 Tax=Selenomonas sputigena (strain ATCC 35185 / DSM 20758 / CCUG 44933 / VPI D19B-28) TaxID=546271 RepID=C9LUX6_SELS3|nr:hypothetical protein SELSPUOL_01266 [Selenomonas sputigena ATCC 35185]
MQDASFGVGFSPNTLPQVLLPVFFSCPISFYNKPIGIIVKSRNFPLTNTKNMRYLGL